mmetsp:Transcript_48703/g.105669  ORF Transcript_48703/g.105669 Transcript_48703/m.105669 type:complete len:509 (-) Transcript_48703:191-1717(-)
MWAQRLLDMKVKWVKVIVSPDYMADGVCKRLIDLGIMPVVRFISKNPTTVNGNVMNTITRLIGLGVRYFETNNEPDSEAEWDKPRPPSGQWETVVVQNLISDAKQITAAGGCPAFVAFNSGPNETRNPVEIWLDQPGGKDLLDNECIWLSIHNYGRGRPFAYPNDPVRMFGAPLTDAEWSAAGEVPKSWSAADIQSFVWDNMARDDVNKLRKAQATPNVTIMTDITGFRMYETWLGYMHNANLNTFPIMQTEGGWVVHDRLDPIYPYLTPQAMSELNAQMMDFVQGNAQQTIYLPDNTTHSYNVQPELMALMPWLAGEAAFDGGAGTWESQAWWSDWWDKQFGLNGSLPIIDMLNNLPSKVRADGPTPKEWGMRADCLPKGNVTWDNRLVYLGGNATCIVKHTPAPNTDTQSWTMTQAKWQDQGESNPPCGPGYIMFRVLHANGTGIANAAVNITHGDTTETVYTKDAPDNYVGNYVMSATLGTYAIHVVEGGSVHRQPQLSGSLVSS